jgi:hypothetical protein
MSIAWIDTPGEALSALTSPIRFTATKDLSFISCSFEGARAAEMVFRDGVFEAPYLESTKVGSSYSVRRTGGWPLGARPTMHVEERGDAAPSWKILYGVDFTTQPHVDYPGPGAYTIAGKTWYLKESDVAVSQMHPYMNVGLGWYADSSYNGSVGDFGSGNGTYTYPHWFFPLSQVPAYSESLPVCLRVYPPGYWGCAAGFVDSTSDTVRHQWDKTDRDAIVLRRRNAGVSAKFGHQYSGQMDAYSDRAIAVFELPSILKTLHAIAALPGAVGPVTESPSEMVFISPFGPSDTRQALSLNEVVMPRANPGLFFSAYGPGMAGFPTSIRGFELWGYTS